MGMHIPHIGLRPSSGATLTIRDGVGSCAQSRSNAAVYPCTRDIVLGSLVFNRRRQGPFLTCFALPNSVRAC